MSKISIDEVQSVLLKQSIPKEQVVAVVKELSQIVQEEAAQRQASAEPKTKNEYTIVLSDPNNDLAGKEFTGWAIQIKAGEDAGTILTRVANATKSYNVNTRAGKKNPIKTFGEALMHVKRKFFKEQDILVKTKEPVRIVVTDNKLA